MANTETQAPPDTFCRHCRSQGDNPCQIHATSPDGVTTAFGPYCGHCVGAVFTNFTRELPVHRGYTYKVTAGE